VKSRSSTYFRKLAKGKPCLVRLPGCDGGGETTVLAHYRSVGYAGTGIKPDDLAWGAWCCANCHRLVDGVDRAANLTRVEIRLAHAEGVMRTVAAIRQENG